MLVDGARFCVYWSDIISILRLKFWKRFFVYVKIVPFSNVEFINSID